MKPISYEIKLEMLYVSIINKDDEVSSMTPELRTVFTRAHQTLRVFNVEVTDTFASVIDIWFPKLGITEPLDESTPEETKYIAQPDFMETEEFNNLMQCGIDWRPRLWQEDVKSFIREHFTPNKENASKTPDYPKYKGSINEAPDESPKKSDDDLQGELREMFEALSAFNETFYRLNIAMSVVDRYRLDINALIEGGYPFASSFDELTLGVMSWVAECRGRIAEAMKENASSSHTGVCYNCSNTFPILRLFEDGDHLFCDECLSQLKDK